MALAFSAAIDDPARFRSSRMVGAHFGLTPKKYQSGETTCRSHLEDQRPCVRVALYEAANVMLTRPVKGSALKSWRLRWPSSPGYARPRWRWHASWRWSLHRMMHSGEQFLRVGRTATVAC